MRRGSLSGAGAALLLAFSLLFPAVVQGVEAPLPPVTSFRLQASNGYEFVALAGQAPREGDEGWIGLFLIRRDRLAASEVTYAAPATVTGQRIDADLGELGRISVARVPTGQARKVHLVCGSESAQRVESERYEGIIEFHGEEGFAEVSATSVPLVYPPPCGIPGSGKPPGKILPGARLHVSKERIDEDRLEFTAIQKRPGARTAVGAEVEEHRGEMEIHRAVWTLATSGVLHHDRRLRVASVRPPDPFSGHGSFRAGGGGSNGWTGDLSVDLPGRSDVRLTGPGFRAVLEHPRN